VIVPPIGIVLILDQLVLPRFRSALPATVVAATPVRWAPFAGWIAGSVAALLAHVFAPWVSDAVVGMLVAGIIFTATVLASTALAGADATRPNRPRHHLVDEPAMEATNE
jgi:cytosine permease